MTSGWVENLSDGPKIVHGPVFYINLEFETCGAGIWEKKINLGPSTVCLSVIFEIKHENKSCSWHVESEWMTIERLKEWEFETLRE